VSGKTNARRNAQVQVPVGVRLPFNGRDFGELFGEGKDVTKALAANI
jgi:hypothetical protein